MKQCWKCKTTKNLVEENDIVYDLCESCRTLLINQGAKWE